MPSVLADAFGGLPQDEKRTLLQRLSSQMPSPLPRLHLANLALRTVGDDEEIIALARNILADLYDERGAAGFAAFEALLKFVNQEFRFLKDAEGWSPQIRLAMVWAHATRLHSLLLAVGYSAEDLASFFGQQINPITAETLLREPDFWDDSLHPHRISRTVFLTRGGESFRRDRNADAGEGWRDWPDPRTNVHRCQQRRSIPERAVVTRLGPL